MFRGFRTVVTVAGISAGALSGALTAPAGAAPSCLPPPNQVLVQLAEVGGNNSALSADVQAVEQADANKGDKSASQVVQDILGAASRNGYQWDCATNRLVAPASAGQPAAGRSVGGPGQAGAAGVGGAVVSAGGDGTSGASSTASPSGSPTSLSAQAAPASSTGGTTNIPIPVIVAGLILCSAALFAAVRRVSRH